MIVRTLCARTLMVGALVTSLTLGTSTIASAEISNNKVVEGKTTVSVSEPLNSKLEPIRDRVNMSSENLTESDLETFDTGLQVIMQAQAETGKLRYTIDNDGKRIYETELKLADGQQIWFYYEVESQSVEATALSKAVYTKRLAVKSGDEWYPKIWAGKDSKGRWVRFNRAAQKIMVGAGGAALKSAICAIPGVGTIGCAFVWGATIVAKKVINKIGRCPKARPWLYAYPASIKSSRCRAA